MGVGKPFLRALIQEHARRPYSGRVCTYARQSVAATPEEALGMFRAAGLEPATGDAAQLEIDTTTSWARSNPAVGMIRDIDFFRLFGLTDIQAIDVSDFEGADIIWDLNNPIPPDLEGSCGLVVDGSLLDNLFDPTTGLKNAARLLAPGGRCFLRNHGNTPLVYTGIPYTMFSPVWFFDYFVWNDFDYCQVYVIIDHEGPDFAAYSISYEHAAGHKGTGYKGRVKPIVSYDPIYVMVYAEKGGRSTWAKTPTQDSYRNQPDWSRYRSIVEGYMAQKRPHLLTGSRLPITKGVPSGWRRVWPDGTDTPSATAA